MRLLRLPFVLALALAPGRCLAYGQNPPHDETPTFSESRLTVEVDPPAAEASVVRLAPVSFDAVFGADVVPTGTAAEITPPAPRLAALARSAAAVRTLQVNSGFGVRRDPFTGAARMHTGVDLKAAYGESVGASLAGTVIYAAYRGGYGNLVIVDHGRGIATMYGHLSSVAVASGQHVAAGQTVGYVGSTGRSTGPHLHYEVRARGHALDPSSVISFDGARVYANGRLIDGPTAEGGDDPITAKPGEPEPAPLPLFQSGDGLSNY